MSHSNVMPVETIMVSTSSHEAIDTTSGAMPSQPASRSSSNGQNVHRHRRSATVGYVASKFDGKEAQMAEVKKAILAAQWIPENKVDREIEWFYNELDIDNAYFQVESVEVIANHVTSFYAAKVRTLTRLDKSEGIRLDLETDDHAVYIETSERYMGCKEGPRYERTLEAKYLESMTEDKRFRVETFGSPITLTGTPDSKATLSFNFVYECKFVEPNPGPQETRLELISDKMFLNKATKNTLQIYQELIDLSASRTGPIIQIFDVKKSCDKRLVVAYKQGTAQGIFSALSDLYHYYGAVSSRKYVEQFSNGITIISVYLKPASDNFPSIDQSIHQIAKDVSLLYCIPQNKFQSLFATGRLSLQETIYGHCVLVFVQHFLNRLGSEYTSLISVLNPKINQHAEILSNIKRRLRTETFTADYIGEIIARYPDLVRLLYANFANTHFLPLQEEEEDVPSMPSVEALSDDLLKERISTIVSNENEQMVWDTFRVFNNAVLKTNFYTPTKVGLSFRLDPRFLPELEYPQPLYGMFLVITSESRGFHLRFQDIARGGIRIVKSRNHEAYSINSRSIFDENYCLANTQQRKNKDIPEGGSKGVILLDAEHQDKGRVAFEKYIDSIIDLLVPASSPGIKDPIIDLYGKPEMLFMGPDENTADLVDWATEHARGRGAKWWKSFFTGKSPKLGGIPHDKYGMTTLSVREFVRGIYRKLNLDPAQVRKMQTGGPDGDLGSNEILLSDEKYTVIIDGSGVLVDPNGIDHQELIRLVEKRTMIAEFDTSKLSRDGYRVLVDETNVRLPSGEVVSNGMAFRNTFHLRKPELADCFVPCGGRPESVNITSVNHLIKDGKCIIPYIVEGANLFLTQDAKLRLEDSGCILFKDASANKGGVTSSSLEVLASLAFDDQGFVENMCVGADGSVPEFYKSYVKSVQEIIKRNARVEFEAIWREHEATGTPRSTLSDSLSLAIIKLNGELQRSELWQNEGLKRKVLSEALPKPLWEKIGMDLLMERVPESYLKSIFSKFLASRFVYEVGSNPGQFAFFDFMSKRLSTSDQNYIASPLKLDIVSSPFELPIIHVRRRRRTRTSNPSPKEFVTDVHY